MRKPSKKETITGSIILLLLIIIGILCYQHFWNNETDHINDTTVTTDAGAATEENTELQTLQELVESLAASQAELQAKLADSDEELEDSEEETPTALNTQTDNDIDNGFILLSMYQVTTKISDTQEKTQFFTCTNRSFFSGRPDDKILGSNLVWDDTQASTITVAQRIHGRAIPTLYRVANADVNAMKTALMSAENNQVVQRRVRVFNLDDIGKDFQNVGGVVRIEDTTNYSTESRPKEKE